MFQVTPEYCLAINPKVGCTSFSRAIVETHYPDIYAAQIKQGADPDKYSWAAYCPTVAKPDRPALLLVRNPIDRFLSAVQQVGLSVSVALDCLLNDTTYPFSHRSKPTRLRDDEHFKCQSSLAAAASVTLVFPEQIQIAMKLLQLKSLPHLNQARGPKPTLTAAQVSQIAYVYASDLELFQRTAYVCDPAVQKKLDL